MSPYVLLAIWNTHLKCLIYKNKQNAHLTSNNTIIKIIIGQYKSQ